MKGTIEAERLRRQGIDVVDLGAGEPDFPTPPHITAAAHAAIDAQFTKYTANPGITELREAVAQRYREDYGVDVQRRRSHHHGRRQAGAVPRGDGAVRSGRRGHHAHARLADARRADQARRRDAGHRARAAEDGFALTADVPARGRDAADARHRHQLAGQSDRRAAVRGRSARAGARGGAARPLDRHRSLLRAADLRQRAAQPAEDLRRRDARSRWSWPGRRRRPTR